MILEIYWAYFAKANMDDTPVILTGSHPFLIANIKCGIGCLSVDLLIFSNTKCQ